MSHRRQFLAECGKAIAALVFMQACEQEKIFGPKPRKFAAWSTTFGNAPFPLQAMGTDTRQSRQFTGFTLAQTDLAFIASNPGQLYICGDEPDQQGIRPEDYATLYHDWSVALRAVDPKARLSPAGFAEPNSVPGPHSTEYASEFYGAYKTIYGKAPQVDEWRFHDFGLNRPGDVAAWWIRVTQSIEWSVSHGANMVLGSWGFLNWDDTDFLAHMREAKALIEGEPRINQAVWWSYENTGYPHFLRNDDGSLTPEGQVYAEAA